ncbi:MAG: membrane protein insertion efficiency factor YidD [Acidobacteria bacterium]|nr:MAG: membrane protein insertion efficiency factor YidD [Acidobacteriota bacterium]
MRIGRSSTKILSMNSSKLAVIVLFFLHIYKKYISPLLPPSCRFTPTCSEYMIDAVTRYGAAKGVYLGLKRLVRCNPFCKGGFDPVH